MSGSLSSSLVEDRSVMVFRAFLEDVVLPNSGFEDKMPDFDMFQSGWQAPLHLIASPAVVMASALQQVCVAEVQACFDLAPVGSCHGELAHTVTVRPKIASKEEKEEL